MSGLRRGLDRERALQMIFAADHGVEATALASIVRLLDSDLGITLRG